MEEIFRTLLITETGDVIEIEYPASIQEELIEDMRKHANKIWNVGNWSDATASFKGQRLMEIFMGRVIGIAD